jgi:hypothetical protein
VHGDRLLLGSHVLVLVECQGIHRALVVQAPSRESRAEHRLTWMDWKLFPSRDSNLSQLQL